MNVEDRQELLPEAAAVPSVDMRRLNVAVGLQLGFLGAKCGLLLFVIATNLTMVPAALILETWSLVWLGRLVLVNFLEVLLLLYWKHLRRPPEVLFFGQTALFTFGLAWFCYGTKLLWFDMPLAGSEAARWWASTFWWYQALCFLVPCVTYSLTCLCLPCLVLAVVRMQVPRRDQRPTPEDVMSRLEVRKFEEHIEDLRQRSLSGWLSPPTPVQPQDPSHASPLAVVGGINMALGLGGPGGPPPVGVGGDWNKGCPICMADFEPTDHVMIMPCDPRHYFHRGCVEHWLRNSQVCPMCRANLVDLVAQDGNAGAAAGQG